MRKFERKSFDVACVQFGYSRSHQQVPFGCVARARPVWMMPEDKSAALTDTLDLEHEGAAEEEVESRDEVKDDVAEPDVAVDGLEDVEQNSANRRRDRLRQNQRLRNEKQNQYSFLPFNPSVDTSLLNWSPMVLNFPSQIKNSLDLCLTTSYLIPVWIIPG